MVGEARQLVVGRISTRGEVKRLCEPWVWMLRDVSRQGDWVCDLGCCRPCSCPYRRGELKEEQQAEETVYRMSEGVAER